MDRNGTRVNLTLPDDLIGVLDRMGKVTGAGRATIIRELLQESLPQFEQMAHALEMASKKNVDAFSVMAKTFRDVSHESDQLSLDMKKQRRAAVRRKLK